MKQYINTSNYYLSTTTALINNTDSTGVIEVADIAIDGVTLPTKGFYWIDVDFGDASKREIFRIVSRNGYTLTYDKRISPNGKVTHQVGATVGLRDFAELLNSLSSNTDNFGQIEHLSGFVIKVYGGNIYASNDYGYKSIQDATLILPASSTRYIMYNKVDNVFEALETIDNEKFLLGRAVTGLSSVLLLEDLRSTMVYGGGEGDMKISIYDPTGKHTDVFNMDNMTQGEENLFTNPDEKAYWNNKQNLLESGNTIKTINGETVLGSGDIVIKPSLAIKYVYETTQDGVSSYTMNDRPYDSSSFMVYVDSGTGMFPTTDYSYDDASNTITFAHQLASNEHAVIWMAISNGINPEANSINNAYAWFIS